MGTLNTSINITSADTLAFSINQTVKGAGGTGDFAESGVKTITPLLSSSVASGAGLLSDRTCGANGAYVFVENPSTNTNNVELVGSADLANAVSASGGNFANITGLYSFTTLKPGDSTIVPLSSGQGGVYAYTTSGTSTINYYIADREGALGESGIIVTTAVTTYKYAVLDSQAGVLSGGNPTPYFTSLDLNVTASYNYNLGEIVNNKGYVLQFTDDQNGDHEIYKFIDAKGTIAGTVEVTGSYSTDNLDQMGGYTVSYDSGSNAIINNFDGEALYTHVISGSFDSEVSNWDECSSDGAFTVEVDNYLGVSGDTATILINKGTSHVLSVLNYGNTDLYVDDIATSFYGSFFFLSIYDDDSSIYTRFQIWSSNGVLLKDLDVTSFSLDNLDYVLYGSNKLQIITSNSGDDLDYLLNYNGATNLLIGHNSTNLQLPILSWTHENGNDYDTTHFYAYGKYPTDSIDNNYEDNEGMHDAESMAIVYSDTASNSGSYHINSSVGFCDIVYVMAGATNYGVHTVANGTTKYIRIADEYASNTVNPSTNLIAFNTSTISFVSGSLQMLAITPTGVASSSLAPKLEDINRNNGNIQIIPIGEYVMYRTYNPTTGKPTFTMAKSATKKSSLTMETNDDEWFTRYNTLVLRNYDIDKMWYYNTATNAFTELKNTYNWFDDYRINLSTTTNGVNDGNQLLIGSLETTALAKMRLIKKGVATAEKQLPITDGNFEIELGSEAVFLLYEDMTDAYKYKLNVYDLNLDLVKTIELGTDSTENFEVVGKRCYVKTVNVDQTVGNNYYSYYMISLKGMAYWLHEDDDTIAFNDKWWWDN